MPEHPSHKLTPSHPPLLVSVQTSSQPPRLKTPATSATTPHSFIFLLRVTLVHPYSHSCHPGPLLISLCEHSTLPSPSEVQTSVLSGLTSHHTEVRSSSLLRRPRACLAATRPQSPLSPQTPSTPLGEWTGPLSRPLLTGFSLLFIGSNPKHSSRPSSTHSQGRVSVVSLLTPTPKLPAPFWAHIYHSALHCNLYENL